MKYGVLKRVVDELGRVVIPLEVRHELGIKERDMLYFCYTADGKIISKKHVCSYILIMINIVSIERNNFSVRINKANTTSFHRI